MTCQCTITPDGDLVPCAEAVRRLRELGMAEYMEQGWQVGMFRGETHEFLRKQLDECRQRFTAHIIVAVRRSESTAPTR